MNIQERLIRVETEMKYMRKLMWGIVILLAAQLGVDLV